MCELDACANAVANAQLVRLPRSSYLLMEPHHSWLGHSHPAVIKGIAQV
jgi:hypothetical protein